MAARGFAIGSGPLRGSRNSIITEALFSVQWQPHQRAGVLLRSGLKVIAEAEECMLSETAGLKAWEVDEGEISSR